MNAPNRCAPFSRRGPVASLFAFLYVLASLLAMTHTHEVVRYLAASERCCVTVTAATAVQATDENHALSATHCPVCDLLAQVVSVEPAPPVLTYAATVAVVPELTPRPLPYQPLRFCDRSSSRAPPTA